MHDDYALYEMKYRAHCLRLFFFNDTATTEIYTLSLHDALPISVAGGWWPARQAMELPPAATLKGQGAGSERAARGLPALLLMAASVALAFVPPVAGIPLAAYAAVALLLLGDRKSVV